MNAQQTPDGMTPEEMKIEFERQEKARHEVAVTVFEAIRDRAGKDCAGVSKNELCEEFQDWGTAISEWLYDLWYELYGGNPGTVDPPPAPPFKNG